MKDVGSGQSTDCPEALRASDLVSVRSPVLLGASSPPDQFVEIGNDVVGEIVRVPKPNGRT